MKANDRNTVIDTQLQPPPWKKQGHLYVPDGQQWWAKERAMVPTATLLPSGNIRIYFAATDEETRGRIGFIEVDGRNPANIAQIHADPVLDLGRSGCFDDAGVTPSCILRVGTSYLMYYIGWQRTQHTPYMLFSGLARSDDGGIHFERLQETPILDRNPQEPFSRGALFVLPPESSSIDRQSGVFSNQYLGFYWSCETWQAHGETFRYRNHLRALSGSSPRSWSLRSRKIVGLNDAHAEFSLGRPWVERAHGGYRLWYTVRYSDNRAKIGVALSTDGKTWVRHDDAAGIESSLNDAKSFDHDMVCHPCVIHAHGRRFLFYNGNGLGHSGIGWAEATAETSYT